MSERRVLAIDAGQSGIKVRATAASGEDLLFPGIRTGEPLLPQLAAVVAETAARTGSPADIVVAGISGLTDANADADAMLALTAAQGVRGVVLAHDSTTSFLGALGDRRGAVVAAGTGVVTLAVGAETTARVDGWGWIMGDAGSGYWIGRQALDAVMRAYDGRGPTTELTATVSDRWPDLSQAYMSLQADPDRVRVVASFAAVVARAAVAGDTVAQDISVRAAHELAQSVRAAIAQVRTDEETFPVCAIGGVFGSIPLLEAFTADLHTGDASVRLVAPVGVGIDGVVALADLGTSHPLAAVTHRAGDIR
ncbi:BadF/BadG/BcrA/BcrD ATPase family protein [Microbacterium sp. NE2HP2]|uniref:N-acetylglucosamine kinase n=1 Tax=Microbacterium plantarum TaxID=1816425 RepID=UPI002365CCAB|nr:BadF/BadG/BcrA/BcrD ATPase family protein [Microbacterium plantarum]MDD7945196.1 BadF/BadG/BcrA/BcrD ATPase family protein [Microbacterium plantarum]